MTGGQQFKDIRDHAGEVAAKHGVPDQVLDAALDSVWQAGTADSDAFDVWTRIDAQIGEAEDAGLESALIELRAMYEERLSAALRDAIDKAFAQSPEDGIQRWTASVAETIVEFRLPLCLELCGLPQHLPEQQEVAQGFATAVECMMQDRWIEAYSTLETLSAEESLSDEIRTRLLVMMFQVQLFATFEPDSAKALLDTVTERDPSNPRVISATGDFCLAKKEPERAFAFYEQAREADPELDEPYLRLGDYHQQQGNIEEAKRWFDELIQVAAGSNMGYSKLLRLHGAIGLDGFEAECERLMRKAIAVTPHYEYQTCLDIAYVLEDHERFGESEEWLAKARSLRPEWPAALLAQGRLSEKQQNIDEAIDNYQTAIAVAPGFHDGYWALTAVFEQQQRWADALELYQRVPDYWPEYHVLALAKAAEMYLSLGSLEQAEEVSKRVLSSDPGSGIARSVLERIAEDSYQNRNDVSKARQVYDDMHELIGAEYTAEYHNRLGNLSYYFAEYEAALHDYKRAVEGNPDAAVYHRNLAGAFSGLGHYEAARSHLETAFELDQDESRFKKGLAFLINAQGNDAFAAQEYETSLKLYQQAVEIDDRWAIIFSNLGGAWEKCEAPGDRMEAIERASDAYHRANELNPEGDYDGKVEALGQKLGLARQYGEEILDWTHVVTPIVVEVASDLIGFTEGPAEGGLDTELAGLLTELRQRIVDDTGVYLPGVRFRGNETDLGDGTFLISIMEVPIQSGWVPVEQRFCPTGAEELKELGVMAEPGVLHPVSGEPGSWIKSDDAELVREAGHEVWGVIEYVIRSVEAAARANLATFINHDVVWGLLEEHKPEVLEDLGPNNEKLTSLMTVCKSLLAERVPILPFQSLTETFDRLFEDGIGLRRIAESIRVAPDFRDRIHGNDSSYSHLALGSRLEEEIRAGVDRSNGQAVLALEPEICQEILSAVRSEASAAGRHAIVVNDAEIRPFLRVLTEVEFPDVPVLARREVSTDRIHENERIIDIEDRSSESRARSFSRSNPRRPSGEESRDLTDSRSISLQVVVHPSVLSSQSEVDDQSLDEMVSMMRAGLFYESGVVLPDVQVDTDDSLDPSTVRCVINGELFDDLTGLAPHEYLVNDTKDRLSMLAIEGRSARNPVSGAEFAIVDDRQTDPSVCNRAGLTTWGPRGYLILTLASLINRRAGTFQTDELTHYILASQAEIFPRLIETALKRFNPRQISLVLMSLLEEGHSIRDLRAILEAMLVMGRATDVDLSQYIVFVPQTENTCLTGWTERPNEPETVDYLGFVRTSFRSYISNKYAESSNTLTVLLLDRDLERRVAEANAIPLNSNERQRLSEAVSTELDSLPQTATSPVILTSVEIRRPFWDLIRDEFPHVAVLAYQELAPDLSVHPVSRVMWD